MPEVDRNSRDEQGLSPALHALYRGEPAEAESLLPDEPNVFKAPPFGRRGGPDVQDPIMKGQNPGLPVMPLPALNSLLDLMQAVRGDLPGIKQPTLVAHGQKDETIPLEDSLEIAGSLGSEEVERLWLARSGHLAGIDLEKHILAQALAKFFARHLPAN